MANDAACNTQPLQHCCPATLSYQRLRAIPTVTPASAAALCRWFLLELPPYAMVSASAASLCQFQQAADRLLHVL